MSHARRLDKASTYFFSTALVLSKLQYIPNAMATFVLKLSSLSLYLIGYALWFSASLLRGDHKRHNPNWYGFAQHKIQASFASITGFIATGLSIAAAFVPVLFPPAAWLYVVSNIIWTIAEYHKLNNPPKDTEHFSYSRQRAYLSYTITITTMSVVTAVAATLILVFPPIAIPATIISVIISIGLGILAFEYWMDSTHGDHKETLVSGSYYEMTES